MADTVLDQVLSGLRSTLTNQYPQRGALKNLRIVGHTPKTDHFIYDICADFEHGIERIAVKIYRPNRCGGNARGMAELENKNLQYINQVCFKKKISRSEEHTSELQSRLHLVCRLLLEKKTKT